MMWIDGRWEVTRDSDNLLLLWTAHDAETPELVPVGKWRERADDPENPDDETLFVESENIFFLSQI